MKTHNRDTNIYIPVHRKKQICNEFVMQTKKKTVYYTGMYMCLKSSFAKCYLAPTTKH